MEKNLKIKTKTTITVETYKFSAVRLRRECAATVCACCGREISDRTVGSICPNKITSEIDTQDHAVVKDLTAQAL